MNHFWLHFGGERGARIGFGMRWGAKWTQKDPQTVPGGVLGAFGGSWVLHEINDLKVNHFGLHFGDKKELKCDQKGVQMSSKLRSKIDACFLSLLVVISGGFWEDLLTIFDT